MFKPINQVGLELQSATQKFMQVVLILNCTCPCALRTYYYKIKVHRIKWVYFNIEKLLRIIFGLKIILTRYIAPESDQFELQSNLPTQKFMQPSFILELMGINRVGEKNKSRQQFCYLMKGRIHVTFLKLFNTEEEFQRKNIFQATQKL